MKVIRAKNYDDMSKKVATAIAEQIICKPNSVLGLATGSTPVGAYKVLVEKYENGDIDFSKITTVNLDEYRNLPVDNDQSYRYFMNENLFDHVNIPKERTFVPNGMESDADKACSDYEEVLKSVGTVDIQLLGLGHDGHIGFNEPSDKFDKYTHCVDLSEQTIEANARFFASADDVPKQAYTMGIGNIMNAKMIIVAVSGKDKAKIVKEAFWGDVTPKVPASILQFHNKVVLIADEDALSLVE